MRGKSSAATSRWESPAADRCENQDPVSIGDSRSQAIEESRVFFTEKNIDVRANFTTFVYHAIEQPGRPVAECTQRVAYRCACTVYSDRALTIQVNVESFRKFNFYQCGFSVTAFTHTTGGSESATSIHPSPSLLEANTFPLRVPKYIPAGLERSAVSASRKTVS